MNHYQINAYPKGYRGQLEREGSHPWKSMQSHFDCSDMTRPRIQKLPIGRNTVLVFEVQFKIQKTLLTAQDSLTGITSVQLCYLQERCSSATCPCKTKPFQTVKNNTFLLCKAKPIEGVAKHTAINQEVFQKQFIFWP